jgi:hypothetical protein
MLLASCNRMISESSSARILFICIRKVYRSSLSVTLWHPKQRGVLLVGSLKAEVPMIDGCFNPVCRRTPQYLRDGRVVRVIRGKDADISVEHYWLCGACYEDHNFVFSPDGAVSLELRSHKEHTDEFTFRDVVLPERRTSKGLPRLTGRPPFAQALLLGSVGRRLQLSNSLNRVTG